MTQHHGIGAKRTASAAPLTRETDAQLLRVARALDNATRVGVPFADGRRDRFPSPSIAFKGDDDATPLLLPLWSDDVLRIKAHGRVCQQYADVDAAWNVDGDALALRNPRWHAFVDEIVTSMRDELGIARAAVVTASLRKMTLVETAAHIRSQRPSAGAIASQHDGMFSSFVVVLPGGFEGGAFVVQTPKRPEEDGEEATDDGDEGESTRLGEDATQETITWRPGCRETAFDLSYAVLYDHCSYETEPVTSGAALCLVYDLATSTPSEVPLYASLFTIQHAVNEALAAYFDLTPVPLAKRHRISPDALRTINEFGAERHFVHLVDGEAWDDLYGDERTIADRLAAFCAQSRGDYVLYLADVVCSQRVASRYKNTHEAGRGNNVSVTLKAPWFKYGQSDATACPPVFVRHHASDVLPIGRVDELELSSEYRIRDPRIRHILERLHGYKSEDDDDEMAIYVTQALVVETALIELRQLANLPVADAAATIRSLLPDAHDEAMQYVRRIYHHRPVWHVRSTDQDGFAAFVSAVVQINDLQLFKDLLRTLDLQAPQSSLYDAVGHFGWDACTDMLVAGITTTPTLRGRVNLLLSTVTRSDSLTPAGPLVNALLSLHPWTAVKVVNRPERPNQDDQLPTLDEFGWLLQLGFVSSPQRMLELASVMDAEAMVRLVAPTLIGVVRRFRTEAHLREVLRHVWTLYEPMLPAIRNAVYADLRVTEHCDKCRELQAFLWSTATEASVDFVDTEQETHVVTVLKRVTCSRSYVRVGYPEEADVPAVLQLTKSPGFDFDGLSWLAQQQTPAILELLANEGHEEEEERSDEEDE